MPTRDLEIGAPRFPKLNAFMRERGRVSFIMGPLGSGKTIGVVQRMMAHMVEQEANEQGTRPTRWLAVRNTYPDLMGTTVRDFQSVFTPHPQPGYIGRFKGGGLEPPTFYIEFALPDGTKVKSEVIFLALDREDAVRKIRGYQVTGIWLHEAKELVKPVIDMLDGRHGRYPTPIDGGVEYTWRGMLGDTNAPDEDHWYYRLAEELRPRGWHFFRQPPGVLKGDKEGEYLANPDAENLCNLPDDYYIDLVEAKEPDWIHVNAENEYGFVVEGKPVHPLYVDSKHCSEELLEPDDRYPLTLGVDFGRTPACAITQYLEHIGRWVGLDEFVSEDMSASIFAPELKLYLQKEYKGFEVRGWGDPAGDSSGQSVETTPIQFMRAAGVPVRPCETNQPLLRRAAIDNPIRRNCIDGDPAFLISPRMKITRKGLRGGFCFRRLKIAGTERFTDDPDKNMYSHPVEALEYAMLGGGEGRNALRPVGYQARQGRRPTRAVM